MSRDDLIKELNNVFIAETNENNYGHSEVISVVAGEKDVLRLLTNYDTSSERTLYQNHPDVHMVERLVKEMAASGQSDIEIVSRELILKFNQAVKDNNEEKIAEIIADCKHLYMRLQGINSRSPERALVYMMIVDMVKRI